MECSQDCNTCNSVCTKECPKCNKIGMLVSNDTVLSLTNKSIKMNSKHYICTNANCDVAYFNENNDTILTNEINVPIWYKKDKSKYIVCYCLNIELKDIVKAVNQIENPTKEKIIKYLGKESTETNCLINNPLGRNCDTLFDNAIQYALSLKKQREEK